MNNYHDYLSQGFLDPNTPSILPPEYEPTQEDFDFGGFIRKGYDRKEHYTTGDGWKIHLSVHADDLPRAWDTVIAPILFDAKVVSGKFAKDDMLFFASNPESRDAGKIVTIYGAGNKSWADIAKQLEIGLAKEGIRPGPTIAGDRMVNGSNYIGYRNERAFELDKYCRTHPGYISAKEIKALVKQGIIEAEWEHNPTKQPDTLQNINFTNDPEIAAARAQDKVAAAPAPQGVSIAEVEVSPLNAAAKGTKR